MNKTTTKPKLEINLEDFFRSNFDDLMIDYSIRVQIELNGEVTFYIRPQDKDGETLDFRVMGNTLIPLQ